IFNTQLSFTRNKDRYYDYFPRDAEIRNEIFQLYSPQLYNDFTEGRISSDELSSTIVDDTAFQSGLSEDQMNDFNTFRQTLINKDRQTQNILISSMIYNFIYN